MSAPEIITFGCRLNAFESEVIREIASGQDNGGRKTVVVNSCAVTAEAERQVRQAIRKARRADPTARLIVTGCAAQISPERYAAMDEVDQVLGNAEKLRPESYAVSAATKPRDVGDIMAVHRAEGHPIDGMDGRARAVVQVQDGCDHRCTFCVIPYGRGPSRSVPAGAVVDQARRLAARGHAEIVLSGVDITSYGADLPGRPTLGGLVRRILKLVPELQRLRLSSIDAMEIDSDLIRAFAEEERLMPYLHLSLQAGDDIILKRMKRRHGRDDAIRLCRTLIDARPGIAFGADLIAGFPTETEAMFARTLDLVEECGLTYLHVFPYSERPGTPAARMPAVARAVRRERAGRLRALGETRLAAHLKRRIGSDARILMERDDEGRDADFARARLALPDGAPMPAAGTIVPARIVARTDVQLIAQPL